MDKKEKHKEYMRKWRYYKKIKALPCETCECSFYVCNTDCPYEKKKGKKKPLKAANI